MKARTALVALAACTALVACGGGNDDGGGNATVGSSQDSVPARALASASALVAYLQELIGASSDSAEPISLGDATLPVDDSNEAQAL
ncbi:MAG TPA: hypothetical protein VEA35_15195 [Ramlibacter sp.]|nr:hypothetical protein [Ramlibacter sp.]